MRPLRLEQIEEITGLDVTVSTSGNLTSGNVQSALEELQSDIDIINSAGYLSDVNLSTGTHDSVSFQVANSGGTNVTIPQATVSLAGLFSAVDKQKLNGIESNATADQDASDVPVTSAGNLTSENVQLALEELQTDIDTINSAGYLTDITSESFVDLTDTPANYTSSGLDLVRVNAGATGLEFVDTSSISLSSFNDDLSYLPVVNLSLSSANLTTLDYSNSGGTGFSIPAATNLAAGALSGTDKAKIDHISVSQAVDLDNMEADLSDIITLSGVASNSTDLGSFTGSTIDNNRTIKQALQDLEDGLEAITGTTNLSITNRTATTLDVASSTGTDATVPAANGTQAGLLSSTGFNKLSNISITQPVDLNSLETNLANLITLTGVAADSTNLGSFTGNILSNTATIKQALQTLENELENTQSSVNNFEWYNSALDNITTPPGTPSTGDRYLIGLDTGASVATAAWAGQDGTVAEWNGASWDFTTPTAGSFISLDDETNVLYVFGGTTWTSKAFESTTASTGLTKVGNDIRLHSSSAGNGLAFSSGQLSVDLNELVAYTTPATNDYIVMVDGTVTKKTLANNLLKAKNIEYTSSGNLFAFDVDEALNLLQTQIDNITSNVTHTGEVVGATALTVQPTAISNKTEVTPASGDFTWILDESDGSLKKVNVSHFLGGTGDTTNNYSSIGDPQIFTASVTGASENFTVNSTNDVVMVTQNGQMLDDSEYSLVGTTLTVTPDVGIESNDEILVYQSTFATNTGGFKTNFTQKTGSYTVALTDHTIECTSGTFTVTLPSAVGNSGRVFVIKNTGAGTITVDGDGSQTIDGSTTQSLAQWESAKVQSNGSDWILI
jgi:hypothetical protein